MRKRIFSINKYLEYWNEPQITSRRFVMLLLFAAAIPGIGIVIFLSIFFYSLNRSVARYKKKMRIDNNENLSNKDKKG